MMRTPVRSDPASVTEPSRSSPPSARPEMRKRPFPFLACLTVSNEGLAKGGGKEDGERADSQTPTQASRESLTRSRGVLGLADGLGTGALWTRAAD
ncbi:hypothetical protein E2C01_053968 [Portunus trituberculatus]|uniref:Uncharacterized protein n=1 Tax=Portunus trituberculatus TaxID=210409 RepID=A0A5B7GQR3_PORTR|nr:hypothetical protein [Portunus trituberculatus]